MVKMVSPEAAVSLAVSVSMLVPVVGFGVNDAVTPLGSPDATRLTLPVNPFLGVTVMVDVREESGTIPAEPTEELMPKFGVLTVRARVAVAVSVAEVPVIDTL